MNDEPRTIGPADAELLYVNYDTASGTFSTVVRLRRDGRSTVVEFPGGPARRVVDVDVVRDLGRLPPRPYDEAEAEGE